MPSRRIRKIVTGAAAVDGAGVHLVRVIGPTTVKEFDPFLMAIQGAFIGLGRTKVPLLLGLLRIWFLRYIFILATERQLQYYSVFWGNLFSNYAAALIAIVLISRTKWVSVIGKREGA